MIITKNRIGHITEDGEIIKGRTDQGFVYWDKEAYENKKGVCYVPELSDAEYTYNDFLELTKGNKELADILFDNVDWQSPATLLNDYINDDEVTLCDKCDKFYLSYNVDKCPFCNN